MIAAVKDNTIEDMKVPEVKKTLDRLVGTSTNLAPDTLAEAIGERSDMSSVSRLLKELPEVESEALLDVDVVTEQLKELAKQEGALEQFAERFAREVFLSGGAKPANVQQTTYELLQKVGRSVVKLREADHDRRAPRSTKTIKALRKLSEELIGFRKQVSALRNPDYVALNEQYQEIQQAIAAEEKQFLQKVPQRLLSSLTNSGIIKFGDIKSWSGKTTLGHVKKLVAAGILQESSIPGTGRTIAYARADVNAKQLETVIPTSIRERVKQVIEQELKSKYSGRYQGLGTQDTRANSVRTLLDGVRLSAIADQAGVSEAHVELMLKYLQSHKLLVGEQDSYQLSEVGKEMGLRLGAVRFMQDVEAKRSNDVKGSSFTFEDYLSAVRQERETWGVPTLTIKTEEGGAPKTFLVDDLRLGDARLDTEVTKRLFDDIKSSADPNTLVIAANTAQGHASHEPRKMRTSLHPSGTEGVDMRDHENQMQMVNQIAADLGKNMVVLHGKHELETANIRVDVQRERMLRAAKALATDEASIQKDLSSKNEISHFAQRKYKTKLHTELLKFMVDVVQPFETKINRCLMNDEEILEKVGLRSNEFEIVQDIASHLALEASNSSVKADNYINATYSEFLALDEVGPDYVDKLRQAMFPELDQLEPGRPIARGGVNIQFTTKDNTPGLSMLCKPEYRFGLSEQNNPIDKLLQRIKGESLMGREVPDIVTVASAGKPWFAMTAAGTAVVSADTLQSNNLDNRFIFDESQDYIKRRERVKGGPAMAGSIAFSGGVNEGIKTGAYTLEFSNPKVIEVLEDNDKRGLEKGKYVDVACISDLQLSSPTDRPSTFLRSLLWAIATDQEEIVLNGDMFQGDNYGRRKVESQLTGIIGVSDQQMLFSYMMEPIMDAIMERAAADPKYKPPRFTFLLGNHETNTDRNYQGLTLMEAAVWQVRSTYRAAFGEKFANENVSFGRKYVDLQGTDIDYSHAVLDFTEETGFRMGVQHYVGAGGKGSKATPAIAPMKHWTLAKEAELAPIHFLNMGHFHTQSFTQDFGIIMGIFGANADASGYEHHLGYPTTVPASGRVRFYTDRPPEVFFATDPYLHLEDIKLQSELPVYGKLVDNYGSLEQFVEENRKMIARRDDGNYTNYQELKVGRHNFKEPFGEPIGQ